jgi:hypothetical protein
MEEKIGKYALVTPPTPFPTVSVAEPSVLPRRCQKKLRVWRKPEDEVSRREFRSKCDLGSRPGKERDEGRNIPSPLAAVPKKPPRS